MRAAALRVGLLALAGLLVLVAAVVTMGGRWWAAGELGLMRFESSVHGLQIGAPVLLRGVRVGQVTAMGLAPAGPQGLTMPVTAEFDTGVLASVLGPQAPSGGPVLPALLSRGLVARLATQSLLTGLLYIDLDLNPQRGDAPPAAAVVLSAGKRPATLIPTEATRLQTLQAQLERLDLAQIGQDLAAVAASARVLLADPNARLALAQTAQAAQSVQALAGRLERELGPLARSAESTLAESRRAVQQVAPATRQMVAEVGAAASQVGAAAAQVQALAAAGSPLVERLKLTADELSRSAASLREATAEDSVLRQDSERALQDVSRAARSLRELSEMLERHPDAVLRGRGPAP